MGMEDMTGKPRSDEDLAEAITVVKTYLIKDGLKVPYLTVMCGTILNCLEELQSMRALLKKVKEERLAREDSA